MSATSHLYAGVPASDLAGSIAQRIEREAIETYPNGVRHVKVSDPDGNAVAFAEGPGA
jgi:hypothetical protein